MFLVAGIDPGKKGGWAVFDRPSGRLIKAGPLLFDDPGDLFDNLRNVRVILIERAQSARDQANQFEYGRGFGRTEAAAMMTGAVVHYTAPAWWKGQLGISTDKKQAMAKALAKIPGLDKYVYLQKHEGIAEAALIGSILTVRKLADKVELNNERRLKPKRKRPSFRL